MSQYYKVVITGATGGIGREIVKRLDKKSELIILVGLTKNSLDDLKKELQTKRVFIIEGDISEPHVREQIKILAKREGGINLLINNAGIGDYFMFEDQNPDLVIDILDINLKAPMLLTQSLLPLLKNEPKAEIINTGSIFGYIGYPGFTAYCASKFGLRGFTQALRRELSDTKVNVRYFAPRATKTNFNTNNITEMNIKLGNAMDSPEKVADKFMTFLTHNNYQKKIGLKESFFVFINKVFPKLPDIAISKQLPIIKKYLNR
jgi:short-subunit dehydrogenase